MLRITVELVPFGIESASKKIGTMLIANQGTGTNESSDYVWSTYDDRSGEIEGQIQGHDHSQNVWVLIAKCLQNS